MSKARPRPRPRADFRYIAAVPTRWGDNDQYGHVNNAVYYFYFDTVVNQFLIERAGMLPGDSPWMGLVVETACAFFAPASYPEVLDVGVRAGATGRSSQVYEIGVFRKGEDETLAHGRFVHVYVDAVDRRPMALPAVLLAALDGIR
jgi:acyl-CoA thioester hydrolase